MDLQYLSLHVEVFEARPDLASGRGGDFLPFYFFSLDLPKSIVNGPIQAAGFDSPNATEDGDEDRLRPAELAVRGWRGRSLRRLPARPRHDARIPLHPVLVLRAR